MAERNWPRSRMPARRTAKEDFPWYVLAALTVPALMGIYATGNDRVQLIAVALGGILICVGAGICVGRLLPRYYAMRLLIVSYTLQFVALAGIVVFGLPLSPSLHPFEVDGAEAPFRVALALLTVPLGALLAALVWSAVRRSPRLAEKEPSAEDIARDRRIYLVVAALVMLLFWPAALENSGPIGYLGRILASTLMVAPFLAGRDGRVDHPLAALWILALLVNAVVGIAAGTRSVAFIAVVLFVAGYISGMPRGGRRSVVLVCAALAMVPLVQLAGVLGVVRDELGRGGLEIVQGDRVRAVFGGVGQQIAAGNQTTEPATMHGVGRLFSWTNMVVPMMTPEAIPYRGFDGFRDEVAQAFQVAGLSGQTTDDLMDVGLLNSQARVYGFMVTSATSVDFTLVADGWSRGGAPVALLFSFIAALSLTILELAAFRLHGFGAGVASILALPAAKTAFFDSAVYPLLFELRAMVMYTLMMAVLVIVVETLRRVTHSVVRRRVAPPLGSAPVGYLRG